MSHQKVMGPPLGPYPSFAICPVCRKKILTVTETKASTTTHILALLMCLFGCWLCAPFLYCTDCTRNVEHTCPLCGAYIGTYDRYLKE